MLLYLIADKELYLICGINSILHHLEKVLDFELTALFDCRSSVVQLVAHMWHQWCFISLGDSP